MYNLSNATATRTSDVDVVNGLGWAGLGWAGLGWAGLGWAGMQCKIIITKLFLHPLLYHGNSQSHKEILFRRYCATECTRSHLGINIHSSTQSTCSQGRDLILAHLLI